MDLERRVRRESFDVGDSVKVGKYQGIVVEVNYNQISLSDGQPYGVKIENEVRYYKAQDLKLVSIIGGN